MIPIGDGNARADHAFPLSVKTIETDMIPIGDGNSAGLVASAIRL